MFNRNSPRTSNAWFIDAIIVGGLLGLFVLVLVLMGRPFWHEDGLGLWTGSVWSERTSQDIFDPYTFTHVVHGMVFYWMLLPAKKLSPEMRFWIAMAIEVAWEIIENTPWVIERFRTETASLEYSGDSIINSLADVAACALGAVIVMRWPWRITVPLAIAEEIVVGLVARDNFTLNVVMLLFPMEGVKEWQRGG